MTYIDIHAHGFLEDQWHYRKGIGHPMCTPDDLLRIYDRLDVAKGCLLPIVSPESTLNTQSNEEVLRFCATHPDRFVPFCNLDPRNLNNNMRSPFEFVLAHYREMGCKGLGEVTCNLRFLDERVQALFAACEKVGFSVTFHMSPFVGENYGLVDLPGMPGLEESLKRFPKLKIFGHSQAFWCEIGEYEGQEPRFGFPKGPVKEGRIAKLMRKYPNLYGDLSANSGYNAISRDRAYGIRCGVWHDMICGNAWWMKDAKAGAGMESVPRKYVVWLWDYLAGAVPEKDTYLGCVPQLRKLGFDIVFAGATSSYNDGPFLPVMRQHRLNLAKGAEMASSENFVGLAVTSWSIRQHLRATQMPLFRFAAKRYLDPGADVAADWSAALAPEKLPFFPAELDAATEWGGALTRFDGRAFNVYKDGTIPTEADFREKVLKDKSARLPEESKLKPIREGLARGAAKCLTRPSAASAAIRSSRCRSSGRSAISAANRRRFPRAALVDAKAAVADQCNYVKIRRAIDAVANPK